MTRHQITRTTENELSDSEAGWVGNALLILALVLMLSGIVAQVVTEGTLWALVSKNLAGNYLLAVLIGWVIWKHA